MGDLGFAGGLALTGGTTALFASFAQLPPHVALARNFVSGIAASAPQALTPANAIPFPPGALMGAGLGLVVVGALALAADLG